MLRTLLLLIVLTTAFAGMSQKNKKHIPPGTVQINDTLFADKTEVTNIGWREYLFYLSKTNPTLVPASLPDTLVWGEDTLRSALHEYYLRHPMFNSYPVVGINYEQAVAFCKWRTFTANLAIYCRKKGFTNPEEHLSDSFPITFYYRLPTEKEWQMLVAGGIDSSARAFKRFSGSLNPYFNTKEAFMARRSLLQDQHFSEALPVVQARSYFIYKSRLYNLIGNVAEMVLEKGLAKGGSFDHTLQESLPPATQHWSEPERWLGFRCVAVLLK